MESSRGARNSRRYLLFVYGIWFNWLIRRWNFFLRRCSRQLYSCLIISRNHCLTSILRPVFCVFIFLRYFFFIREKKLFELVRNYIKKFIYKRIFNSKTNRAQFITLISFIIVLIKCFSRVFFSSNSVVTFSYSQLYDFILDAQIFHSVIF